MVVLFVGSTVADPAVPAGVSDTSLHLLGYALLSLLLTRAVAGGLPSRMSARTAVFAFVGTVVYGGALEVQQAFIIERTAEIADVYANGAGGLLGTGVCWAWGTIASRLVPTAGERRP
jgi:VanZ family protein